MMCGKDASTLGISIAARKRWGVCTNTCKNRGRETLDVGNFLVMVAYSFSLFSKQQKRGREGKSKIIDKYFTNFKFQLEVKGSKRIHKK